MAVMALAVVCSMSLSCGGSMANRPTLVFFTARL